MKHLSSHILKLILAVSALIACANCYADEVAKIHKKESCGFEWVKVSYSGLTGAQTTSGDWIVPLDRHNIYFDNFDKGGKYYGYFLSTKEMDDGKRKSSLITSTGEELVPHGRYGTFFWSEGRMVGTGPNGYETININLSKLLLPSPQADLNQLLIGSWKNVESPLDEELSFYKYSDFSYFFREKIIDYIRFVDGKWTISGQYIIFKSDEDKIDAKYSVKVLSPTEIKLISIQGSEIFQGKYRKKQKN